MVTIYKTFDDERELKEIERDLAREIGVPYVRCSYDGYCSHKEWDEDELNNRREEEILEPNEYAINYEIYQTKEDYDRHEGGYDGEVYELVYSTDNGEYINLEYCWHMLF